MDTALIKQAAIFADLDQDELERIAEICSEQKSGGSALARLGGGTTARAWGSRNRESERMRV